MLDPDYTISHVKNSKHIATNFNNYLNFFIYLVNTHFTLKQFLLEMFKYIYYKFCFNF